MTIRLIALRHGQTIADLEDRYEGRADYPLTDYGRFQVRQSIERILCTYDIDVIFYSPLLRAKQTSQLLSENCGVEVMDHPLLA